MDIHGRARAGTAGDSRRGWLSDPEPATHPGLSTPMRDNQIPTLLKPLSFVSWLQLLTNLQGPVPDYRARVPRLPSSLSGDAGSRRSPPLLWRPARVTWCPHWAPGRTARPGSYTSSNACETCHVVPHQRHQSPLLRAPAPELSGPSTHWLASPQQRWELQLRNPGSNCTLRLPPPRGCP